MFQSPMQSFEISTAMPMFVLWIVLLALVLYLIRKKKLNKLFSSLILIASILIGGIVLGAIPNAVMPIQQLLLVISLGGKLILVVPMLIILLFLLGSTLLFGRIFCGYACPLGALQELLSKLNFKSNLKRQNEVKYAYTIPRKGGNIIRWIFFGILIVLALIWSVALLQVINPFLGFSYFLNPLAIVFLIPLLVLAIVSIASIFIYRPWCRFLCPFGAISSLTSRLSRYKLTRTDACTECGLCEKICPTQESFRDSKKGECYLCNRCVDICPVDAIKYKKKE
ncbi:MAG: 4Fe-4S binding protein [Promethearchaeota archaeon]|nr:MAG: 4Fe-4S binding protein [Candidatus Lokiarchaeota archaeon]